MAQSYGIFRTYNNAFMPSPKPLVGIFSVNNTAIGSISSGFRYSRKRKGYVKKVNRDTINDFRKQYFFLSNFYMTPVMYEGIEYPSSEHAFQAAKTLDTTVRQEIAALKTPGEAKRKGNDPSYVILRPDWEKVKDTVMADILKAKFEQNPKLTKRLLDTGIGSLIEGNWWHDSYWGVCSCGRCKKLSQKNKLGYLLVSLRKTLKEKANTLPENNKTA